MRYRFGEIRPIIVDKERMQVLAADGSEIPVRRRNFDLLVYLIENRHRFVEFEEIRKAVWVNVYISDTNEVIVTGVPQREIELLI